ncbi:hypothetical protein GCM10011390_50390 [Aureimonas endophytica]|uniref:Ribbon-helix-helix protein CopG domain-containing protein n=1 Tax=Aureimonas endophytica TaxID=2027858 RepID=A0A917A3L6_9HYPH|nr:ribbon-helix-helix protein, CopG family [Aureimonas endophytica]GGE24878.1 hypothetical protein GCM10011390_50390 [Aureimonas endophytica]
MLRLVETLTFRAPSGTCVALEEAAKAEGKSASELAREAIRDRIARRLSPDEPQAA